jgi:hypothetical protein
VRSIVKAISAIESRHRTRAFIRPKRPAVTLAEQFSTLQMTKSVYSRSFAVLGSSKIFETKVPGDDATLSLAQFVFVWWGLGLT